MTLGGCIFAEKRVSEFNDSVRRRNRALERSRRAWGEEQEIRAMAQMRRERDGELSSSSTDGRATAKPQKSAAGTANEN